MPPVLRARGRDAHGRTLALPVPERRRWLDPATAFLVADVLADDYARVPGFGPRSVLDLPFTVAVKTGTSTDYRNSWCVGFTRDHVVGVWVGNFDATPIHGLAGAHRRRSGVSRRDVALARARHPAVGATAATGLDAGPGVCPVGGRRRGRLAPRPCSSGFLLQPTRSARTARSTPA